jgi:hypothetical protein
VALGFEILIKYLKYAFLLNVIELLFGPIFSFDTIWHWQNFEESISVQDFEQVQSASWLYITYIPTYANVLCLLNWSRWSEILWNVSPPYILQVGARKFDEMFRRPPFYKSVLGNSMKCFIDLHFTSRWSEIRWNVSPPNILQISDLKFDEMFHRPPFYWSRRSEIRWNKSPARIQPFAYLDIYSAKFSGFTTTKNRAPIISLKL